MGSVLLIMVLVAAGDQEPPPPPPPTPDSPDFDAAPPPPPPPGSCVPDCRRGYVCIDGACVQPPGPVPDVPPPPVPVPPVSRPPSARPARPQPREQAERPSVFAMHLNLADAALHGLTGAIDFLIVPQLAMGLFIEARAMNLGPLSYMDYWPLGPQRKFGFSNNYSQVFDIGMGMALGVEKFWSDKPGLRGWFAAGGVELLTRRARLTSPAGAGWVHGHVVEWWVTPHARGGYRFRGHNFLFGLGARLGAGVLATSTFFNGNTGTSTPWGSSRRVYFDVSAIIDVGFFLD
ncbi:MAG: hypothetical protein JNK82_11505 [Myxococcaceae bacterium]|nr:hypothetical protein [Myxococcaceae bacterium]